MSGRTLLRGTFAFSRGGILGMMVISAPWATVHASERHGLSATEKITSFSPSSEFQIGLTIILLTLAGFIFFLYARETRRRVEIEARLRKERAWFSSLLESAPDATLIVDQMGTIIHINRQAEVLFEGDRKKLLGKSIDLLVPDNIRGQHKAHRDVFVTASAPREMGAGLKLSAKKLTGELFPVEISLSLIQSDGDVYVAAAVRDVSERREKADELARREEWFRSLLESAPDATIVISSAGNIVRVNRQAEILFSADREKLIGEPIEILVPEEIRAKHVALRDSFVKSTAPREMGRDFNLSARKLTGEIFPVEISLSPIETEDGSFIAAAVRDITERRDREAKLTEKDAQLRAALENMSGGIMMIDKDLVIRVFNRKFAEMYRVRELRAGMPLRDVLMLRAERGEYGAGDPDELVEQRLAGYRDRNISRVEDVVIGGSIVEGFRAPAIDGGMVCVFNDITERKQAERKLAEKTKQLEAVSENLSHYLSPQIYNSIFSGERDATVTTHRKKLSVFFSDIKNFTATTEGMEPEDMTFLLNDYLTKMSEIALEHGGTIDKYIGDAIVVFFGDPETQGVQNDARACVRMAVEMQRRMIDLRAKWTDMGFDRPFHIRCGINTGYCNVGNFGSEQRIDYTIIGGQVNFAARLEAICAVDGVTISESTYRLVRDEFEAKALDPVKVKGIQEPVTPFAVEGVYEDWCADERYIRRDIWGMRLWMDLMRMNEEQRQSALAELREATELLENKTIEQDNKIIYKRNAVD